MSQYTNVILVTKSPNKTLIVLGIPLPVYDYRESYVFFKNPLLLLTMYQISTQLLIQLLFTEYSFSLHF